MSLYRPLIQEIVEVQIPEEHIDELKQMVSLICASIERDGLPYETGTFDLGKLDARLARTLFLVRWITANNNVIENLNVVLNDMRALPENYVLFRGSPKERFYLLVRTYFHEFYRFREIHNQVVKAAANRGYIDKDEVPIARQIFHDAFKTTIELRNMLVHQSSETWKGRDHFHLSMLSTALKNGYGFKDKQTGAMWDIGDTLQALCISTADELRDEGVRMSNLLKGLAKFYVGILYEE